MDPQVSQDIFYFMGTSAFVILILCLTGLGVVGTLYVIGQILNH